VFIADLVAHKLRDARFDHGKRVYRVPEAAKLQNFSTDE